VVWLQGDQMSLRKKITQKAAKPIFIEIDAYLTYSVEKVTENFWLFMYVIFKNPPKIPTYVDNHPIGENSPKLVTLLCTC
jgi:hypothetical protein